MNKSYQIETNRLIVKESIPCKAIDDIKRPSSIDSNEDDKEEFSQEQKADPNATK
jgi:hypothetical protein